MLFIARARGTSTKVGCSHQGHCTTTRKHVAMFEGSWWVEVDLLLESMESSS